jgi:tetratricopeptide (TPR) repeat protein
LPFARGAIDLVALALGSTLLWPWLNLSKSAEPELERAGLDAMEGGHTSKAIQLLEMAARMKRPPARAWYNLEIPYRRTRKYQDALPGYEQAQA